MDCLPSIIPSVGKEGRMEGWLGGEERRKELKENLLVYSGISLILKYLTFITGKKDKRKISSPIKYIYLLLIKEVPPSKQLFYYLNTPWYSSGHNNKLLICILSSYIIKAVFWNIIFTSIL